MKYWSPGFQLPCVLENKNALCWNAHLLEWSVHHHFFFPNEKVWRFTWTSFGWRNEWKGSSLTQPVDTVTCKSLILESGGWIQVCNVTIRPKVTPQAKANSLWSSFDQTSAYMCRASPYPDLSFDLFLKKKSGEFTAPSHMSAFLCQPHEVDY